MFCTMVVRKLCSVHFLWGCEIRASPDCDDGAFTIRYGDFQNLSMAMKQKGMKWRYLEMLSVAEQVCCATFKVARCSDLHLKLGIQMGLVVGDCCLVRA